MYFKSPSDSFSTVVIKNTYLYTFNRSCIPGSRHSISDSTHFYSRTYVTYFTRNNLMVKRRIKCHPFCFFFIKHDLPTQLTSSQTFNFAKQISFTHFDLRKLILIILCYIFYHTTYSLTLRYFFTKDMMKYYVFSKLINSH